MLFLPCVVGVVIAIDGVFVVVGIVVVCGVAIVTVVVPIDSSIFGVIVGTVVDIEVAVAAVPHILTAGVGNYFCPRATLRLYMCLAGLISVKKPKLMLTFCSSRARCSPWAVCCPLLSYMNREFLENNFTRNSFFSSLRNVWKPTKKNTLAIQF